MTYQSSKALQCEQLDLKATYKTPFSVCLHHVCPYMDDCSCERECRKTL